MLDEKSHFCIYGRYFGLQSSRRGMPEKKLYMYKKKRRKKERKKERKKR